MVVTTILAAGAAHAASRDVQYGPVPSWVTPPPSGITTATPDGAPMRVIFYDTQVHVGPAGQETYLAYRTKILKPEALSIGNITAAWNPASDDIIVHRLKILRAGQVIDVLGSNKFRVLERENNLDLAMLDGDLTAALQAPGLQVGDELEFGATIRRRDPTLGAKASGAMQLPVSGAPGVFRARLVWAKGDGLHWRASRDLGSLPVQAAGGDQELVYELRDPVSTVPTEGAPARYNVRRLIEFSQFATWADIAHQLWPLYARAATLARTSPLRGEVAKIAAASADPQLRAEAALRLVQDRIRYVYVGLDGGNLRPMSADETWTRRFGDCKAKTVLLLALLNELGIPAEPVLVNTGGGDGLNERLPTPAGFDHILVRATIAGRPYWLDGARMGDRRLGALPAPASRWGLPLRAGPVELEPIALDSPTLPQMSVLMDLDATAGFDKPAQVHTEEVLRGDGVLQIRTLLSAASAADAERLVKRYFQQADSWIEPETASWRYDEGQGALILNMSGQGKLDWSGDDATGRSLDIPAAGFTPPNELKRPKDQDQSAPWVTDFPTFKRWTTVIRLPRETGKWRWGYQAASVDQRLGGIAYWREAQLKDGVIRTTMSRRTYKPEITADEAKEIGEKLPSFDNNISRVFEADAAPSQKEVTPSVSGAGAKDPKVLTAAAQALIEAKRYDEAIKLVDQALAVAPKFVPALATKAFALGEKGEADASLRLFGEVAAAQPSLESRLARAQLLIQSGRNGEALRLLDDYVASKGADPDAAFAAATLARQAGAEERALAMTNVGLKSSPTNVPLLQLRLSLEDKAGLQRQALDDAEAAVRASPEQVANFTNRGFILRKLGRKGEALEDFDEAARIDPLNDHVLETRALLLGQLGRKAEAKTLYDRWVAEDNTGAALNGRCWAEVLANEDLAKAENDCAAAVKLGPTLANHWDTFGVLALRQGRWDEAIIRFNKALALDPKHAASIYGRGVAEARRGEKARADADMAAAKALSPNVGDSLSAAGITP